MTLNQYMIIICRFIPSAWNISGNLQFVLTSDDAAIFVNILLWVVILFLAIMLLGLGVFYAFWRQQRGGSPVTPAAGTQAQPTSRNVSPQVEVLSIDHEYALLPFQLVLGKGILTMNMRRKEKELSTKWIEKKAESAKKKWQKNGQLDDLKALALKVLLGESGKWFTLEQSLQELPLNPEQIKEYRQQALQAIQKVRTVTDPVIIEEYCCTALLLHAMIRPHFSKVPEQQAAIDFDMGFACAYVARNLGQLSLAQQYYKYAERFFQQYQPTKPVYLYPYIKTQISLGDISFAISLLEGKDRSHYLTWAVDWYTKAAALYKQMSSMSTQSEQAFFNEIDKRIQRTKEDLARIQVRHH